MFRLIVYMRDVMLLTSSKRHQNDLGRVSRKGGFVRDLRETSEGQDLGIHVLGECVCVCVCVRVLFSHLTFSNPDSELTAGRFW